MTQPDGPASTTYVLMNAEGRPYRSARKGTIGGHRPTRVFGRLDCPAALRAIARGGYVTHRVFFADQETALRAGYRPCAVCLRDAYRAWKGQGRRPVQQCLRSAPQACGAVASGSMRPATSVPSGAPIPASAKRRGSRGSPARRRSEIAMTAARTELARSGR